MLHMQVYRSLFPEFALSPPLLSKLLKIIISTLCPYRRRPKHSPTHQHRLRGRLHRHKAEESDVKKTSKSQTRLPSTGEGEKTSESDNSVFLLIVPIVPHDIRHTADETLFTNLKSQLVFARLYTHSISLFLVCNGRCTTHLTQRPRGIESRGQPREERQGARDRGQTGRGLLQARWDLVARWPPRSNLEGTGCTPHDHKAASAEPCPHPPTKTSSSKPGSYPWPLMSRARLSQALSSPRVGGARARSPGVGLRPGFRIFLSPPKTSLQLRGK